MAYTNPNKVKKYSGSYGSQKQPQQPKKSAKKAADKDIVAVDSEGNILKDENNRSIRLGSIWDHAKGGGFVLFDREALEILMSQERPAAKIFARKPKDGSEEQE